MGSPALTRTSGPRPLLLRGWFPSRCSLLAAAAFAAPRPIEHLREGGGRVVRGSHEEELGYGSASNDGVVVATTTTTTDEEELMSHAQQQQQMGATRMV